MKKLDRGGFTMVELLIVLAIIAILAAVAIPVYSSQLEASRKKVDESNLRAATGIAAQDYIVRNAGSTQASSSNTATKYRVYTLKDNTGSAGDAKNMLVFAVGDRVNDKGEVITNTGSAPSPTVALTVDEGGKTLDARSKKVSTSNVNGKEVFWYPVQQNGGKGWFEIEIGENGVVKKSQITTFT